MDESLDESFSYDENLVDHKARRNLLRVAGLLRQLPKKSNVECGLCKEQAVIRNLHDMFRVYACATSCAIHHASSIGVRDFGVFFEVESFIMKRMGERRMCSIKNVLEYRKDTKEMYDEALRDQLVAVFKTHFVEKPIKINCEQDVESITYRCYKRLSEDERKRLPVKSLELILVLLFNRREPIRFFKVFWSNRKSYAAFKLALLLSMSPESDVSTRALAKEFEGFSFEKDSLFPYGGGVEELCKIDKMIGMPDGDIDEWFRKEHEKMYWMEHVRMWGVNREHSTSTMDSSMLELCIKNRHYEDGWLIYRSGAEGRGVSTSKACILCLKGLRDEGKDVWTDRVGEVAEKASQDKDPQPLHSLIDDVMARLDEVSEGYRVSVLRKLSKVVDRVSKSESMVVSFLGGLQKLYKECNDPETCEICMEYSTRVYVEWRKTRKKGFLFFRKQGEHDGQIYSAMLEIYGAAKDCRRFCDVYQDLVNASGGLSRELYARIESLHGQECEDCMMRRTRVVARGRGSSGFRFMNRP